MLKNATELGARLTWSKSNGEWGLSGVDLSALPPAVYGALCKLKDYEDELEHRDIYERVRSSIETEPQWKLDIMNTSRPRYAKPFKHRDLSHIDSRKYHAK